MMIPLPGVGCVSFVGQHEKRYSYHKMFHVCVGRLFFHSFIAVIVLGVLVCLCLVDSFAGAVGRDIWIFGRFSFPLYTCQVGNPTQEVSLHPTIAIFA